MVIAGIVVAVLPTSVTIKSTNPFNASLSEAVEVVCGSATVPLGAKKTDMDLACADAGSPVVMWLLLGLGVVIVAGGVLVKPAKTAPVV